MMLSPVEVGILQILLVVVGALVGVFAPLEVVTFMSVAAVAAYMYSWSWEVELWSPGSVYAALGDSFTCLVLDWYATLSVTFSLFVFFLRHISTMITMIVVVMSTNSVPATPTPTSSDISLVVAPSSPLVCGGGVVIVVAIFGEPFIRKETGCLGLPTTGENNNVQLHCINFMVTLTVKYGYLSCMCLLSPSK